MSHASHAKFATEVDGIKSQVRVRKAEIDIDFSGSLNEFLGTTSKYDNKLILQEGELVYVANAVSSKEAKWFEELGIQKSSDYYIVEFDYANGSETFSQNVKVGTTVNRPKNPTKEGFIFDDWYFFKEDENGNSVEEKFDFSTKIKNNISIYAKYDGEAIMKKRNDTAFWEEQYRTKISSIIFKKEEISVPEGAIKWEIQADSKCSKIVAYLQDDEKGGYILYIVSPYTIYANPSTTEYFRGFSNLKTFDFSNFDTSKVITMRYMFGSCTSLSTLDLNSFNTKKVTNMYNMFDHCTNLSTIELSNFNTKKVTKMYGMFQNCSSLSSIDLSSLETDNLNTTQVMFENCTNLSNITFSTNFRTDKLKNMRNMFKECKAISVIDLSNFNTSNVTDMRGVFYNCPKLETIYVSEKWSTEKVESSSWMFRYTTKLIGGNGTKFSSSHNDKEYARIDKGESEPGYFTQK